MTDEIIGRLTLDLAEELLPTTDEVGAVLRARTRSDASGGEIGTFDDTTRPTGTEVESYIAGAQDEVLLRLPETMPLRYVAFARRLTARRAAMSVELSFDPDRTGDGTAYARLQQEYETGMTALLEGLEDIGQGVVRHVASLDVVSPTLVPYPDDLRELIAPPWPFP